MEQQRPESGPMRFGKDWTGVFIRGDNAGYYAFELSQLLGKPEIKEDFGIYIALKNVVSLLSGSDERGHTENTEIQQMKPFLECVEEKNNG